MSVADESSSELTDSAASSRRQFCGTLAAAATSAVFAGRTASAEDRAPAVAQSARHSQQHDWQTAANALADNHARPANAAEALAALKSGNQRFAVGKSRHPHESADWRQMLEGSQHPYACILGCADSRVCPELLFDQGFGDLFVVRVAGNIVDLDVTASIEYAVDHLHTPLVVVLGHTHCGAVTATLDHLAESQREPEEIVSLLYRIEPAVAGIPESLPREQRIDEGVRRNVDYAVRRLQAVPDLRRSWKAKSLEIVGAVYDMHTGRVKFLDS